MKRVPPSSKQPSRTPAPIRTLEERKLREVRGGGTVVILGSATDDWETPLG